MLAKKNTEYRLQILWDKKECYMLILHKHPETNRSYMKDCIIDRQKSWGKHIFCLDKTSLPELYSCFVAQF